MKRFLSILLSLAAILTLSTTGFAGASARGDRIEENEFTREKEFAAIFLESVEQINVTLCNPIALKNVSLEQEAVVFSIQDSDGYIIVNIKDYSIPEYSIIAKNPFTELSATYIYNGPLQHYELIGTEVEHLKSKERVQLIEIGANYIKEEISESEHSLKVRELESATITQMPTPRYPINTVPTWDTSYYCGVDGAAILLKYWDMSFNDNFLPSAYQNNTSAQKYLLDNQYLVNSGLSGSDIVYGGVGAHGLRRYLSDRGLLSSYDATAVGYSFATCKTQMEKGYILLAGTSYNSGPGLGSITYANHWIIPYTYKIVNGVDNYLIINDGWGSNGITVSGNSSYYDFGLVYIYEK